MSELLVIWGKIEYCVPFVEFHLGLIADIELLLVQFVQFYIETLEGRHREAPEKFKQLVVAHA